MSLQQARQAAILEHAAAGLVLRAVTHDVVLVMDRLDGRAATRAGLALVAVDLERQRQLVGDRELHDLLVVGERAVEDVVDRGAQRRVLLLGEVCGALERRQLRSPEDLVDPGAPDAGDDPLVPENRVQRPRSLGGEALAQVLGWLRPGVWPERGE